MFANGRIYRAFEDQANEKQEDSWCKTYRSFVISAPIDSDLLDANNWTFTNLLPYAYLGPGYSEYTEHKTYNPTGGWIEGNVVADREGNIYNILRLETGNENGYIAKCTISKDNTTISYDKKDGIIRFNGGITKFVIRYDEVSDHYIAIVNPVTSIDFAKQRNVLAMSVSKDLINWEIVEILLVDETLMPWYDSCYRHAYQYPDWVFDGDDLLVSIREAADDALAYHEANRVTFYRIKDFRKFIGK